MASKAFKKQGASKEVASEVEKILEGLEWAEPAEGRKAIQELLKLGKKAVEALVKKLSIANDENTVRASFALDGMCMAALEAGKEDDRDALAMNLAKAIHACVDSTARCIVLKCLEQLAHNETISCLGQFLDDVDAPEFVYALNALRRMQGTEDSMAFFTAHDLLKDKAAASEGRKQAILTAAFLECPVLKKEDLELGLEALREAEDPALTRMLWAKLAARRAFDVEGDLLAALDGSSKIDVGQARRAIADLVAPGEDYDISDRYGFCDEEDCDDDDCCCHCGDDDCDCDCDDDCDCDCDDDCDDDCDCDDDFDCDCDDDFDDDCDDCDCEDDFDWDEEDERKAQALAVSFFQKDPCVASLRLVLSQISDEDDAFKLLKKLAVSSDRVLRKATLAYVNVVLDGTVWTERLVAFGAQLQEAEQKADFLEMLGNRGDVAARGYVMSCLRDSSALVQAAALQSARKFCGNSVTTGTILATLTAGK